MILWYIALYQILDTIYMMWNMYMSNLENPRFTERTSTNLGRSHRLPCVCTIMIYGKLGGVSLAGNCYTYIYICTYRIHRNQRPIWVSLMWILQKYSDITLKRGTANSGRSHRLPCVFKMSVQYIFSIAGVFAVAHIYIYIHTYM